MLIYCHNLINQNYQLWFKDYLYLHFFLLIKILVIFIYIIIIKDALKCSWGVKKSLFKAIANIGRQLT